MKVLKWLDDNIEKYVCVALFSIIITIMLVNIFMRFGMKNAIPWASDAVLFIFVWFVWFCISFGFKENSHVRVTILLEKLPKKMQIILEMIIDIIILLGFILLIIVGISLLTHSSVVGKTGLLIKYPMWSLYAATPVGASLSVIRIVQNLMIQMQTIKNYQSKKVEC